MAHPWSIVTTKKCVAAAACAFFAIALFTSAPARSNSGTQLKAALQKGAHAAQHLGGVNPALPRQFSVILKTRTHQDADLVASYFRRFGMVVRIAANNRSLHVSGTFGKAAAASNVQFERVKVATETFIRTNRSPQFPPNIAKRVAATSISPGVKMRELNLRPQAVVVGPQTGYSPADYASIYNANSVYASGINGDGSTVDIAACFNIDPEDVASFESRYGLPSNRVHIIHVDGILNQFGQIPGPDLEPTLDVERVIATAPGAQVNLYLVPDCFISQFVDVFQQIAEDGHAVALSISYGLPEADYAAFGIGDLLVAQNEELQDVADSGIATFAASGDNGSWGDFFATGLVNFLDVLYPASDPNVISVGGTTVEQTAIGTRLFEYAWGGSGGGFSGIFPIPPWQAATPGVASGLFKNLPDISLDADPNTGAAVAFLVSLGPVFPVGGTSVSSPTWAGYMALVNQNRHLHGHASLGSHTVQALYSLQGGSVYNDITVGANGYFGTRKGYDNVTGFGVPDVAKLVKVLQ